MAAIRNRSWLTVIAGVLVLPMAVVSILTVAAPDTSHAHAAATARVVTAAGLEEAFGIRVNLIAVTADGGLVDLRYTVVNKDKASRLLRDAETMPALFVETTGAVLMARHAMAHQMTVIDGAAYFLLFPNAGGAIQRGTSVSVVIDDIRLAAIAAQS